MSGRHHHIVAKKLQAIQAATPKRAEAAFSRFIEQFYHKTPFVDMEKLDAAQAAAVAATCYAFVQERRPGKPKIAIYTPSVEEAGSARHCAAVQVLNDDKPFLVDSLSAELTRLGFTLYETLHPLIHVRRDKNGKLLDIVEESAGKKSRDDGALEESLIYFLISPLPDGMTEAALKKALERVLDYVFLAVSDWRIMLDTCVKARDAVAACAPSRDDKTRDEAVDFLDWATKNNFIFLGCAEYALTAAKDKRAAFTLVEGSEFGICRAKDDLAKQHPTPPDMERLAKEGGWIEITKSDEKSLVHRAIPLDVIVVKRFDAKGALVGEYRFLGLFTSIVYYLSADAIPFIRRKIASVLARAGYRPASHSGKALKAILEFFPRDELFQISEDDLFDMSMGIMSLEAKPDIGMFFRVDGYERFISCLVFMPRDKFNTFVRKEITALLEKTFGGTMTAFYTQMTDSPLARVQYIVKTTPGKIPPYDKARALAELAFIINYWTDTLRETLAARLGYKKGEALYRVFRDAFPKHYVNTIKHDTALHDIEKIIACTESGRPEVSAYRAEGEAESQLHLKLYSTDREATLSDMLPVLEHMGCRVIDVETFSIRPDWEKPRPVMLRDFRLARKDGKAVELDKVRAVFEEALVKVWGRDMEDDGYNALVLKAGLPWRHVVLLRAYGKYLKQAGLPYNEAYVAAALGNYPEIVALLVGLFETRFDPKHTGARDAEAPLEKINAQLAAVSNLAEDQIIRRFTDTLLATWRTNFYQMDKEGAAKPYISFKFDSSKVPGLPLPVPYAEIFVYSIRTEGIHLRGGKVARGGLRWSDRPEDFRTEVLGLMKAQMVKNAVIVPVGSKGGFVVKRPPEDGGKALLDEGVACYRQFLSGLLDITDNISGSGIVPPKDVVRHDGDDPYLVVAADKGTATFSDIANGISQEYGFWLGDAFASGGSAGYDHKKMGITARGGWVSVERHFHEMGRDIRKEDFTVTGIGGMSGDVFGNGMLLSKHIKLVAAFNHAHIFIDPDPDPAASFKERERLFCLPHSGWLDYDAKLISKGGGVFERSAKSIKLSGEAKKILGTDKSQATPDELIRIILKAPVDLLWNGGIGTYVKAEAESNEQVGDRANDSVRVNGAEVRCKVIGEGGNLGCTQRGRIEYARSGGRLNTDSIDNSAGVDCSDHEVNIKIALADAERSKILSRDARDTLLAAMTEDVAELVLRDNRLQTQAITIAELQGYDLLEAQAHLMHMLEEEGRLNRTVEKLPSDKEIQQLRAEKKGLTRPELSILLSYAKMSLYDDILDSSLPDLEYFSEDLLRYFPKAMQEKYRTQILRHRLRREIVATSVTNSIVNRAGIAFMHGIMGDTGCSGSDVARAYIAARDAFGLRDLWDDIEALDGKVAVKAQVEMFAEIARLLERGTVWFLRNVPQPLDITKAMGDYGKGIGEFVTLFPKIISEMLRGIYQKKMDHFLALGTPKALAERIASLKVLSSACDVVNVANHGKLPITAVGQVYYELGEWLELSWLRELAGSLPAETGWDKVAVKGAIGDLFDEQRRLTISVIEHHCKDSNCATTVAHWHDVSRESIERFRALVEALKSSPARNISMLYIALKHLRGVGAMPPEKVARQRAI